MNCLLRSQKHQRERTISVREETDSSLTPTQQSATFSIHALMVNISKTSARVASTLTNIPEHASGPTVQTEKVALKLRKSWKTASNARKKRTRTTSQVRLSLIHISHTQKIVKNSTFVSTESNHVSSDAQLAKSSMMRRNVATHPKLFPDGKFTKSVNQQGEF